MTAQDGNAALVPIGQHPATFPVWDWLLENSFRLDAEQVGRIEELLRHLSSDLWELDRSGR